MKRKIKKMMEIQEYETDGKRGKIRKGKEDGGQTGKEKKRKGERRA
jgi:hypothetical protein